MNSARIFPIVVLLTTLFGCASQPIGRIGWLNQSALQKKADSTKVNTTLLAQNDLSRTGLTTVNGGQQQSGSESIQTVSHESPMAAVREPLMPSTPATAQFATNRSDYPVARASSCASASCRRCGVTIGVACADGCFQCQELDWKASQPIPFEAFAQGEYIGPSRLRHMTEYRLRVDDSLEFVYRLTGQPTASLYRLNVGDTLRIESLTIDDFDREVIILPDGTITLSRTGQIQAVGRTVDELREDLNKAYAKHIRDPRMVVTPLKPDTTLTELRNAVDGRFGAGGQTRQARVTPEGTIQLPAVGSVPAQGLSLGELKAEIEHRYAQIVHGIEVTPILVTRAPRAVYVVGEVRNPGRFSLEGPTTVMQAIALSGSWNIGAKLNHVVVLRRDHNWQLVATRLRLHDAFFGKKPCPDGEIWLRDSDIVIVPKSRIQWTGDLIELFFTRGLYGVLPVFGSFELRNLSVI